MPDETSFEVARYVLLLDTCGEEAMLALTCGPDVVAEQTLGERAASRELLGSLDVMLRSAQVELRALAGIGVVNGPGSFTGVRVGLAVAKGLCESGGLPLAMVSRLAVLAEAAGLEDGFAVLRAGREEVYVRDVVPGQPAREWMCPFLDLRQRAEERTIVYTERALQPTVGVLPRARWADMNAAEARRLVERCLAAGGDDPATADANYVRREEEIYARQLGAR